jgi:hypothetical protein
MKKYTDEDINEFIKNMKDFERKVVPEHLRDGKNVDKEKEKSFIDWVEKKLKKS